MDGYKGMLVAWREVGARWAFKQELLGFSQGVQSLLCMDCFATCCQECGCLLLLGLQLCAAGALCRHGSWVDLLGRVWDVVSHRECASGLS